MDEKLIEKLNYVFYNIKNKTESNFFNFDENLTNFSSYSISLSIPNEIVHLGIDVSAEITSLMKAEVERCINKVLIKSLLDTSYFNYILIKDLNANSLSFVNDFLSEYKDFTNLVTNIQLGCSIQDNFNFKQIPLKDLSSSGANVYPIGKIHDLNCFLDPCMEWNDTKICFFNSASINIKNQSISQTALPTMAPRMKVDFDLAFEVGDSKVLFIITPESKNIFKKIQRDIKIDSIIGDDNII